MRIRRGVTRTVLLVGNWAIKAPTLRGDTLRERLTWFCRGVLANQSEFEWTGTKGLNPVVRRVGVVNIYRRADPVPDGFDGYKALTPEWCPAGDCKLDNVGVVDGETVWIDYDMSWNGPARWRAAS